MRNFNIVAWISLPRQIPGDDLRRQENCGNAGGSNPDHRRPDHQGHPREMTLDLHGPTDSIKDPWGNLRKGAKISTTINRLDCGITYNNLLENGGLAIGNLVRIEADLESLILKPAD